MDCRPPALAEEGSAKQEGGHPPVAMARVFHPVRRQGGYFLYQKIERDNCMEHWLSRTEALIGTEQTQRLQQAKVAILGLGGVGAAAAEAICRAGVGNILLMDHDIVDITNINRQLFATTKTVGQEKCLAAAQRLQNINPDCKLTVHQTFYQADTRELLFQFQPNFVIDAIDTVTSKLDLAVECQKRNVNLVMSMGTGNRIDPSKFQIGDISDTAGCGCALARVMRRELKKRGILHQAVVYSTEFPQTIVVDSSHGKHSPGSISFCPPVAGYCLASYVVQHLIKI